MNQHDASNRDELERRIGLLLDGRLPAAEAKALEAELAAAPPESDARRTERALRAIRAAIRAEQEPAVPAGLAARIHARVGAARQQQVAVRSVLPFARRLLAAAALVLISGLFAIVAGSGAVHGGNEPDPNARTIEDEIRSRTGADGSLVEFLEWHYLRRER
jgi:anti-sigma factor RsiW